MTDLPVLDIKTWDEDPDTFAEQLRSACHNVGFFLLHHDLSPDLVRRQLSVTKRFFDLSQDEKETISYDNNPYFRGYMRVGVENTGGVVDVREQVEFGTEYPKGSDDNTSTSKSSTTSAIPPPYERLQSSTNPWPDSVFPMLRPCTEEYVHGMLGVASRLREAMCVGLGYQRSALNELFGSDDSTQDDPPHWFVKLISYPGQVDSNNTAQQQGVGAHTDTNFLTLVLQDYSGGLQVFTNGRWIDVPACDGPDVLVCNLGEQAEILTRGYFLATPHRVLRHTAASPRTSAPFFYNPKFSTIVKPIDEIVSAACTDTERKQNSKMLKWERPIDRDDNQWRMKGNIHLDSVGDNTFKSLARSHPAIFEKHHPDLTLLASGKIAYK